MLAQGDARGAADAALKLDRADSWGCSSPTLLPWRSVASVALAQLGEEERALELAQEELRLAQQLGTPRAVASRSAPWRWPDRPTSARPAWRPRWPRSRTAARASSSLA